MFRYLNTIPHHVFRQHSLQYKLWLYFSRNVFCEYGWSTRPRYQYRYPIPSLLPIFSVWPVVSSTSAWFLFPVVQEKRSKVVCSFSELGVDPWKRSTAAIVAIELLSRPHRTFLYSVALDNNNRSMASPPNIYCFKTRKGIFIPDAVALPSLCLRLNMRAARFLVIYFQLLTSCLFVFGVPQELVRLRGDAHRQLRDGGRGGDVHQARLPALHLGPVSSSGVSIALPIRFFFFICDVRRVICIRCHSHGFFPLTSADFQVIIPSMFSHPFFFPPAADADSAELLSFSVPGGESLPDSVWLCLDVRVARTSPKT